MKKQSALGLKLHTVYNVDDESDLNKIYILPLIELFEILLYHLQKKVKDTQMNQNKTLLEKNSRDNIIHVLSMGKSSTMSKKY